MKLHELVDIKELEYLIENKYVSDRKHPSLPLRILNYTPAAVEIKEWSHTLSYCRGLVYDLTDGEVCAIPFKKFWNHDDASHVKYLPPGIPVIYDKLDGSYLNLFFYKGIPIVSTRGSFESEQAIWAQKYVDKHIQLDKVNILVAKYNYIFEVIISSDKKVVNYGYEGLVFLGFTRLFDGTEYPPSLLTWIPCKLPQTFDYEDFATLAAKDTKEAEGYVAVWYTNGAPAFRVKIKFETYKLLHRMYFQTTAVVIWELVKNGENIGEYLKGADPNLLNWALAISLNILTNRTYLDTKAKEEFRDAIQQTNYLWSLDSPEKERRKTFAMYAMRSKNPGLLFLLYDANFEKYEEQLWKLVKPENARFRDEGEDS